QVYRLPFSVIGSPSRLSALLLGYRLSPRFIGIPPLLSAILPFYQRSEIASSLTVNKHLVNYMGIL
ncbi:hypothetical protein, partial [Oceanobacillus senegalensis]|uniref:hypothetical protein n=1 Tax=Oceanobacillus senegalensis TaxID=1936063 RepID=UPI001C4F7508